VDPFNAGPQAQPDYALTGQTIRSGAIASYNRYERYTKVNTEKVNLR
jgi:hypothetical protein